MSYLKSQEQQLKNRFDEARKILETIISLAEKKTISEVLIDSMNLEKYVVEKFGFNEEPDFDAENPSDGPKIEDEKCFRKLVDASCDKQLWLVHPKVVRWITVAEAKLSEQLLRKEDAESPRFSDTSSYVNRQPVDSSSSSPGFVVSPVVKMVDKASIVKRENSTYEENSEISDDSVICSMSPVRDNAPSKNNVQNPAVSCKSCYFLDSKEIARNLPSKIRCQKFNDERTIGRSLDRWWGVENESDGDNLYVRRVEVIVKIRSLHEPSTKSRHTCWWCSGRQKSPLPPFAIFAGEKPRPTCTLCKRKLMRRGGCYTRFAGKWIELPRIFDNCDLNTAIQKLDDLKLSYDIENRENEKISEDLRSSISAADSQGTKPWSAIELEEGDFYENEHSTESIAAISKETDYSSWIPEIYQSVPFTEDRTIVKAVSYWWSSETPKNVHRFRQRANILAAIKNLYPGPERPVGVPCCWWCGATKCRLQTFSGFPRELPRPTCSHCIQRIKEQAFCVTRIKNPDPKNFRPVIWWKLPPIFENCTPDQSIKSLASQGLINKSTLSEPWETDREKSTPNDDVSLVKDPQVQKSLKAVYGNSESKPSIPDTFLTVLFENQQTIGEAARFWFGASSAGMTERYAMRVAILRKVRSLFRGAAAVTGGKQPRCWWCGADDRKLQLHAGVFVGETSHQTCLACCKVHYCRAGSVTRVPADGGKKEQGLNFVWWHLPRVYDKANTAEIWEKLKADGLVKKSMKKSSGDSLNAN